MMNQKKKLPAFVESSYANKEVRRIIGVSNIDDFRLYAHPSDVMFLQVKGAHHYEKKSKNDTFN